MKPTRRRHQQFWRDESPSPPGRLLAAGLVENSGGAAASRLRVWGSYALVYVLEGSGFYRDVNQPRQLLRAGDLVLIFPEVAHAYGPSKGASWRELYVVFEGPVFEQWRQLGLLNPDRPVHHLQPVRKWRRRLLELLEAPRPQDMAGRALETCRFLTLLTAMLGESDAARPVEAPLPWPRHACSLLESDLGCALDMAAIARQSGLSYENFRKQFRREIGVAPARYRLQKRIEAAETMLQQNALLTNAAIAASLGFSDESHFARRFKQFTGCTPGQFRQRCARPSL